MTDEEINRKFDVVADHLATVAVNQQKSDARLDRLERVLMLAIRAGQRDRKETRESINALVAAQARTEESLAKLAQAQSGLVESLAHTDKRVDALIDIIREERNGEDKAS
jgi:hypothetical protein